MSDQDKLTTPELAALSGEADKADAIAAPVTAEGAAEAQQVQAAQDMQAQAAKEQGELSALLQMLSGIVSPMFPSVGQIYTPDTCNAVAAAAVPVMVKHGWSVSSVTAGYGEEIALAGVVLPLGWLTYKAVQHDIAAMEAAAKAEKKDEAKAPGAAEPLVAERG